MLRQINHATIELMGVEIWSILILLFKCAVRGFERVLWLR